MTIGRIPSVEGGIQPTIVDAKGDLIAATAADTVNRLAVGSNDQVLVADSAASTGLAWKSYGAQFVAGKNKIINGDFGVWQRGTSFTPATNTGVYTTDRFLTYLEGTGATRTISRQNFTLGSAPVAGYESQYFLRFAQSVGPSGAIGNNLLMTRLEDVRTLAGQTVTFSFWAKAASSMTLDRVYAWQVFGTGGSPSSNVLTDFATNVVIGTSWTRYSYTITIPSISGKTIGTNNDSYLDIRLQMPLGAGVTFTFDTWGWQIENGSVATPFTTATGTIQGELAACQRYYWRFGASSTYPFAGFGHGSGASTTQATIVVQHPVPMRVVPTSIDGATLGLVDGVNAVVAVTSTVLAQANEFQSAILANVSSGLTQYRWYRLSSNNSANGYFGLSAEL
jgi:ribosomal protein L27